MALKRALDINPGESDDDRRRALEALDAALREREIERNDFAAVTKYLADMPSRLLVVSLEDLLGVQEQVNFPALSMSTRTGGNLFRLHWRSCEATLALAVLPTS